MSVIKKLFFNDKTARLLAIALMAAMIAGCKADGGNAEVPSRTAQSEQVTPKPVGNAASGKGNKGSANNSDLGDAEDYSEYSDPGDTEDYSEYSDPGDTEDYSEFSDPGDGVRIYREDGYDWWGYYLNEMETKTLGITNFNGESFLFSIATMEGPEFDGAAAVEGPFASYMDMEFEISDDFETISVSLVEWRDDSADREIFIDVYYRTHNEDDDYSDASEDGLNEYIDEAHGLRLMYPDMFDSSATLDENGMIARFASLTGTEVLAYWSMQNTYDENAAEFMSSLTTIDSQSLGGNVVIGYGEDLNQETGEVTPYAGYWVVDPEWIACVNIELEAVEEAAWWFGQLENDIVSVERLFD
ncbi:MAG: hypothetical protein LBT59_25090 [Clostridiales bacterium]|nr:hypothetical protein [Clostridiales bacterium]